MTTVTTGAPIAHAISLTNTTDPTWNARLADYLRLDGLSRAENAFGAMAKANAASEARDIWLEEKFGPKFLSIPAARVTIDAAGPEMRAAEEAYAEAFLRPLWAAQRAVVLTPAPNLAAALFKIDLIEREEVWNDSTMQRDCMEIVAEDMARLAQPSPARVAFDALTAELEAIEASEATDESIDRAGDLCGQIVAMPAPGAAALRWKLDYLLNAEAGSTGSYSAEFVAQTIADYRRMLGGE